MPVSQKEYGEMVKKASPNSKSCIDIPCAFVIGGLICVIGQALTDFYSYLGFDDRTSAAWCTVTLVFLSALLTGLGVYEKIAKHGGAGTLVPVTGFAKLLFLIKISHTMETPTTETLSGLPFFMAASASFAMRLGSLMGSARISSNSP